MGLLLFSGGVSGHETNCVALWGALGGKLGAGVYLGLGALRIAYSRFAESLCIDEGSA